jgi:hypothetical protein
VAARHRGQPGEPRKVGRRVLTVSGRLEVKSAELDAKRPVVVLGSAATSRHRKAMIRSRIPHSVPVIAATAVLALSAIGWSSASVGATPAKTVTHNLIRDPGAEAATPNGGDKVAVPGWVVGANNNFTAVAYGTSGGFPTATSPGPKDRSHNFFAGGPSGNISTGSQVDSLAPEAGLIRSGHASYTLSGWLGGYSSQSDRASVVITWAKGSGKPLGSVTIGPVTEAQRMGMTGMLFRSISGVVPKGATEVVVVLRMVRQDGEYVDGYADNLSLTLHKT